MSKIKYDIQENNLVIGLDANEDGQNSLEVKLSLSEAIQEAFKKGVAVEGVKSATVKFEGTKLIVVVDSDKDGEALLTLSADLFEGLEETGALK